MTRAPLLRLHGGSPSESALLTPLQRAIFRIGLFALAMAALIVIFVVLATT